ncbi:hypothetical protein [Nocardia heshunensis]
MREVRREVIRLEGVKSLVWIGGRLFDIAAGWRSIPSDGAPGSTLYTRYGSQFDAAAISPRGDVVALTATTGTKALLMTARGKLIREVNRSYYCAQAYRYPLALFTLPDGRTGLAHCPEDYNQLELEIAATGERLTTRSDRDPDDFFHSRLDVSPDGRFLLSAGWIWHPVDALSVFDLHRALTDPAELDTASDPEQFGATDVGGACFAGDDIVIGTSSEAGVEGEYGFLAPNTLARWSSATRSVTWQRQLGHPAGDLVRMGTNVLSLYQHPRLFDATSGELIAQWPDLPTGEAESSIVGTAHFSGPARIAVDEGRRCFAVTDGEQVTVVHLG